MCPGFHLRGGGATHISFEKEGVVEKSVLNSAENEILYNIVTATERGDRGECHIPSLTFQNPEEGVEKTSETSALNKKR